MPIRLIKVSKNLNVGINSLVEFLHKKGIEIEANPNAKIEDEQYDILIAEFGKDRNIRREAIETREKMHHRDEKRETVAIEGYELPETPAPRKKVEKEVIETEIPNEMKPHFNVVGSIDLDNLLKRKPGRNRRKQLLTTFRNLRSFQNRLKQHRQHHFQKKGGSTGTVSRGTRVSFGKEEERATVRAEEEVELHPVEEKEEVLTIEAETSDEKTDKSVSVEEAPQIVSETSEEATPQAEVNQDQTGSDNIFRLHKNKLESNIVVKGSIDLDAINDRTRPPRKSRAQRKKERLEREQKALDSKKLKEEKVKLLKKEAIDEKKKQPITPETDDESKKRKRKRIRTAKVIIDKQSTLNPPSRVDRKPSIRKPIKAEVSEEDVQKQIKETLARLTEKKVKRAALNIAAKNGRPTPTGIRRN